MVREPVAGSLIVLPARIEPAREGVGSAIPDASRCRFCPDGTNQFDPFAPIISLIRSSKAPNRLRPKANFVSGFKLIGIFPVLA
jgi:hypothetical protein